MMRRMWCLSCLLGFLLTIVGQGCGGGPELGMASDTANAPPLKDTMQPAAATPKLAPRK